MAAKNKHKPAVERIAPTGRPGSAASTKSLAQRIREAPPGSPLILRVRLIAVGVLVLVLALIFAVPRRPEPPRALDHPSEAFVDRAALVSKEYAWTTAGMLLREARYQMVVYADASPPDGALSRWTSNKATAWRVGEQNDNGIALFVFRDARIARAEVGYGLEGQLPDLLVRRLLEDRLAPRFAAGDYEGGFDAFIASLGEALGGDEALRTLWLELGGQPRKESMLFDVYAEGIERAPRMIRATWRTYIEGGPTERLFVLVCVGIFLAILAATVLMAVVTVAIVVKLAKGQPDADGALAVSRQGDTAALPAARLAFGVFGAAFGAFAVALFSMILMFALSLIGDQMHRKGDFSGAGAQIVWTPSR
jgi:uncharacterized membrane protein YgcG